MKITIQATVAPLKCGAHETSERKTPSLKQTKNASTTGSNATFYPQALRVLPATILRVAQKFSSPTERQNTMDDCHCQGYWTFGLLPPWLLPFSCPFAPFSVFWIFRNRVLFAGGAIWTLWADRGVKYCKISFQPFSFSNVLSKGFVFSGGLTNSPMVKWEGNLRETLWSVLDAALLFIVFIVLFWDPPTRAGSKR